METDRSSEKPEIEATDGTAGRDLREEGRTDSTDGLRDRLASAPPLYAEGAFENPAMNEDLMEILLRNRGLTGSLLNRISGDDRFARNDAVKRGVVFHPATSNAVSMRLVQFLHWRDLAALTNDNTMSIPLRNLAEQVLVGRLHQLPSVEKTTLARNAGRSVLGALLRQRDIRILPDLLRNPKVAESDVILLIKEAGTPTAVLGCVARDEKWSPRPMVRLGLVENPSTPVSDSIRLLTGLTANALQSILRNPRIAVPVKNEAKRLLNTHGPRTG